MFLNKLNINRNTARKVSLDVVRLKNKQKLQNIVMNFVVLYRRHSK